MAMAAPMAGGGGFGGGGGGFSSRASVMGDSSGLSSMAGGASLSEGFGFKTGGAQDAENFRENVKAGHLPLPTDVTYEGIVKDYYFDTASSDSPRCTELFCPTYSLAVSQDPLVAKKTDDKNKAGGGAAAQSSPDDVFLAVGLDSGLTKFTRPKLNLVIVLDVSGSMDSGFGSYYYDKFKDGAEEQSKEDETKSKLDVAKEVLLGMLDKLKPEDSVAVTLFSDNSGSPKKLGRWGSADTESVRSGIKELKTIGSTNFQSGLDEATNLLRSFTDCKEWDPATTENRIVVLTDAQINTGEISDTTLMARLKANAADGFYMTVVGIGLDFNTELAESILKVKGANYFSVHTPGEFRRRLADEFDSAVSPLVFDLELRVDPSSLGAGKKAEDGQAAGWKIAGVYGSPDTKKATEGSIMKVLTLFPSPKTEEGIKGGVVLLRMQPPPGRTLATAQPLKLSARYTDRSGKKFDTVRTVQVPAAAKTGAAFFQSSGVRKAVALARLTDALQLWLVDSWAAAKKEVPAKDSRPDKCDIILFSEVPSSSDLKSSTYTPTPRLRVGCPLLKPQLGKWERQSKSLSASSDSKAALKRVQQYLKDEAAAVKDGTMDQEVTLLQKVVDAKA